MRALPLKTHLLIMSLVMAAAIVIILLFILWPSYQHTLSIESEITTTKIQLEQDYQRTRLLHRSLEELNHIETLAEQYKESAFRQGDELSVIATLQSMAAERGLEQTLDISDEQSESQISLSLSHIGHFADHVSYLRGLEQLPYYVLIDRLQWQKVGAFEDGSPRITLSFFATIYARTEKK